MPRLNREYKKGKPYRDSRLFVIIAEGDREDKYFAQFNLLNSRIRVLTIPREQNASAPKHFVGRLKKAEEIGEYTSEETDEIWFVCDTDRWRTQLNELKTDCEQRTNWNLAISNPCFEVWLHYHSGLVSTRALNCSDLKAQLPQTTLGGFDSKTYCQHIESAINYAAQADTQPNGDFPEPMQTNVYRLARKMIEVLGNNWQ